MYYEQSLDCYSAVCASSEIGTWIFAIYQQTIVSGKCYASQADAATDSNAIGSIETKADCMVNADTNVFVSQRSGAYVVDRCARLHCRVYRCARYYFDGGQDMVRGAEYLTEK